MKSRKFFVWGNAALGIALALVPFVLSPVCGEPKPDGTHMKCWYSGIFITIMGILIVGFSLMALRGKFPSLFTILSAAAGLMCWLVPNGIVPLGGSGWECGLCADPGHACRAVTLPALGCIVTAIIIVSAAALVLKFVLPESDRVRRR